MSNIIFGFPLFSDDSVSFTPAYSAGSWQASLPLANLKDRYLQKVARSTNALAASTVGQVDLGVARDIRVLALVGVNLTGAATVRWMLGTSAGGTQVHDSGAKTMSFSAVSAEDRDGLTISHIYVLPAALSARHVRFEIVDTANPAGYVQVGRLVVAGGYQPTFNPDYGATLGLQTATTRNDSEDSAALFDVRPIRRYCVGVLSDIPENEAFTKAWLMQRRLGKHGQLFLVWDPADTTLMHERSFLGVFEDVSALEFPYFAVNKMAFKVVEEI